MAGLIIPDDDAADADFNIVLDRGVMGRAEPTDATLAAARALIAQHDARPTDTSHGTFAHRDTTDAEALANSQKLRPDASRAVGMPKLTRIILDEVENMPPTGQMFSVNGRAFCIRPGEPVDISDALLEVIDNAVISKPITDPKTLQVVGHRNAHRFPYRRVA